MNEQWRSRITIEPGKRGGRPCIRGMRITVYDILSYPDNRFRVFYQVNADNREVRVLAVGVKDRNRLLIGGEEFAG